MVAIKREFETGGWLIFGEVNHVEDLGVIGALYFFGNPVLHFRVGLGIIVLGRRWKEGRKEGRMERGEILYVF